MRAGRAVLLAGAIGYALAAASTTPFTKPADILTGLAIVAFAVLLCVRWPLRTRSLSGPDSAGRANHAGRAGRRFLPWLLLVVAFTAWELFNYLVHGTRAHHPTFSSITDAMDRYYVLKALLFLGWLAGAWVIAQRGSGSGAGPQSLLRSRSRSRTPRLDRPSSSPGPVRP